MGKERCKEGELDSFHGNFLYEQAVPRDHFLVKLNQVVDWQRFTKKLLKYYKGQGERGQAPYDPTLILKMLLLSYLFNISERQTEELVNDSLSAKCFVGLAANKRSPDHSTLTVFKERLIEKGGMKAYESLFDEIIEIAQEKGVRFGKVQIIDSVHTVADVNLGKDKARQKEGKPPRDRDACRGVKGERVVWSNAKRHKETDYFYGYKDQVSLNAEAEMITSVKPGYGDEYDGRWLPYLVERDLKKGMEVGTVAADRGYDDGENHYFLEQKRINSAIRLHNYRTEKKDKNKGGWAELKQSEEYQEGLKERYKIERKFGEMKKWHGFGRCRYVGILKHAIQCYLTCMVVNLKRIIKLLTGVGFREETRAYLGA